ncbi:saccharopine dehydrogenase family protein [Hyphomicrobium sp. MC8b]|uniref:saccharopine dehydrogenase family protein n=1 Tax=Hyphomicrobium sp. MC8b TaxID=300273 RepID=UPI00391CA8BD
MIITLLGGAGLMGAGIVRDLLSDRAIIDIAAIRICDSARERMEQLSDDLKDVRISLVDLDAADAEGLKAAISGSDMCINCVPTLLGFQMTIFEAALAAKVPYIDLGGLGTYTVKQLAEHERFKAAGVTAVIGVGADPGMSNVLCRAVADEFDEIDSIKLYWAAEFLGEESPVLIPPYSVSTVLAEYAHESTQFYNGQHVTCAPMSGREILELPEPWGRCEFMHSSHSEQLTVPLADGFKEKGIKEFSWKLHLPHREHEIWVGLVKAGFGDFNDTVEINGAIVRPLDVLNKVIDRNIKKNANRIPVRNSYDVHFAIGTGRKDGVEKALKAEVVVKPNAMYAPYVDACTSMNASIAAQLILSAPMKPGVWAPEEYFDVPKYFNELQKREFLVSKTACC